MRRAVFGEPVTASEVERLSRDQGAFDFVRLCGALIGAALAERAGSFTLPEISERVNVPDRGVDATYTTPGAFKIPETGGLVGPGRTVYQFKYRDTTAGTRGVLLKGIVQQLRKDLRRRVPETDRYVLMTNLDLSGQQQRRLREALLADPRLASKVVVVWGAAEIAQALNAVPRLRHVFISQGGLCSLDTAESALRTAYAKLGWPLFVGREEEKRTVESFAGDPTAKCLLVVGPRYSGRTRLVIEALKSQGASVVWASEPEAATLDVFRDLDSHESPGLLVVDGCSFPGLRAIWARAVSSQRLKTIAIATGSEHELWREEPGTIMVNSLPYAEAASLVRALLPGAPPLQESWIIEVFAGLPGLVLHVAALLRDGLVSPASDLDTVQRQIGEFVRNQYLADLRGDARQALEVASVLSVVGADGDVRPEVDAVSAALGIQAGTFERARDELEGRGLLRRRGRFVEVIPPRLADEVASRALRPNVLTELTLRLPPPALLRFLDRFGNLPSETAREMAAMVFGPDGWFPDLSALSLGTARFRALVPAAPVEAVRCLERLLGPLSADALATRVTGDLRRTAVSALDSLALRSRTFERAARLLLALAEAENEMYGNNAKGTFVSLFHWNHREVAAPLPVRLDILEQGSRSTSAACRAIVAKACGGAFREHGFVVLHHATRTAVPEGPGRPKMWDEVRHYGVGVLAILDRLIRDTDAAVEGEAVAALLEATRPLVMLSILPDGLHDLGRRALDALEHVGRESRSARRRARVVSALELLDRDLGEREDGVPEATATVRARIGALIEALTSETLTDRLRRWTGPRSWGQQAEEDGFERAAREIRSLAAELVTEPQVFAEELPWLTSEEAEHRAALFHDLGKQDRGEKLLDPLLEKPGDQFWAQALAAYFQGWYEAEPQRVGGALDALIAARPDLSGGALAATMYVPTSPETPRRVQEIAEHGRIRTPELARAVSLGLGWDRLTASDAGQLIAFIDDGTRETRSALLRAFWLRMVRGAEITARLEALAWTFLESALPADEGRTPDRSWDALAARLGERDSKRLLDLFERLLRETLAAERARCNPSEDVPLTWKTLLRRERQGVLQTLLGLSLVPDPPYWLSWALSKTIRPDEDGLTLVAFAERHGIGGALAVAEVLEADKRGFWELARALLARWGQDERLRARLASRTLSGAWSGSAVPMISERIRLAGELRADSDPKVVRWAVEVLTDLEEWKKTAAREDREEWIWDMSISRAELEEILGRKRTPERLWAIGRLLKDAPDSRVQELLAPEDILDALPRLGHLDERTRRKWEGWARHWRGAD